MAKPETRGQSKGVLNPIRRQHIRTAINTIEYHKIESWKIKQWLEHALRTLGEDIALAKREAPTWQRVIWLNEALDRLRDAED